MLERYSPPEKYSHIKIDFPRDNMSVLFRPDKKLTSLDIGDGIFFDNELYRITGWGEETDANGTKVMKLFAHTIDQIEKHLPPGAFTKAKIFKTTEIDEFVLPQS